MTIAFDLDGTLAHYGGFKGPENIGAPIEPMMTLMRKYIDEGETVVIFTARTKDSWPYIKRWLDKYGFFKIEITNIKRPDMDIFYDDRCRRVEFNTGVLL